MADVRVAPEPEALLGRLEAAGSWDLLDAVNAAVALLAADPGSAAVRPRSFGAGLWAIPVRTREDDWIVVWQQDADNPDLVRVRYIGPDIAG